MYFSLAVGEDRKMLRMFAVPMFLLMAVMTPFIVFGWSILVGTLATQRGQAFKQRQEESEALDWALSDVSRTIARLERTAGIK
jgi:hypothetical protein